MELKAIDCKIESRIFLKIKKHMEEQKAKTKKMNKNLLGRLNFKTKQNFE